MQYGAHLPLIDFDRSGWMPNTLASYTETARQLGYSCVSCNDHLEYQKPWLDGIVGLASVVEHSGQMQVATTVSLPVVRGPAVLAKAASALDIISGGRLVLGVGPGSSARDYQLAGVDFNERWPRLDESIKILRRHLGADMQPFRGRFYAASTPLEPRPTRPGGVPIWIGSWGSDTGLRRVARLGDGWLASAYNTTPALVADARERLGRALARSGRSLDGFECSLATMWTYVTEDRATRDAYQLILERMLSRPAEALGQQVLVGPAETCAAVLRAYARAGIDRVFIWPLGDAERQLERFAQDVLPLVE
jgi:alkanesulfonate monooxygenase SsuD/methylene tetrahydromethanopterin reductase-like flavin-dependent oxidoreductase (luciferase family)